MATLGAKHRYEVTGIATFGGLDSLGGATIAIWDLPTAQTLLDKRGRFDGISIAAKDGTSPAELIRAVQPLVPASLEVKNSEQQAAADAKDTNVIVNAIRYFLLGFGAIALFVGAFVIFNTLSITVAQRTREFATLRTLGASRKQVMRSVVIEGVVIGLLASVIGLFAGFGLAKLLSAIGGELPEAGMVFALRTVLISLALGTGITVLASIVPARRATRVPPIAAVREGSTLPPSRFAAHSLKTAVAVSAASVAAICVGDLRERDRDAGGRPAARPGDPGALRGRGVRGPAHGQAADPPGGLAGTPQRRRRRRAGQRELGAQPQPHRLDRRRADDRTHARDRRRRARRRHAQHGRVGRDRPGRRRVHPQRQRRRAVRRPPRATRSHACPA